ncbi:MAG TPA: prolyl oligopeptidase family serine peptidase [Rhizomicrobium sp.]|nr:prolyl oligopeptidase family serine peptidase [Rhizomicrobium sp.]
MVSLHYVTIRSLHETPLSIAARLRVPQDGKDKHPAVVLLHGSAGPSLREGGYADVLNEAGFVTLEPDQWSARGLAGGASGRPRTVIETLPDLFGARAFLERHPAVDSARIGVGGFSFGGVATMLAATHRHNDRFLDGDHFRAFMPVYPATWTYNRVPDFEFGDLVDAPMLLITGASDQYDNDPEISAKLVAGLEKTDREKIRIQVMPDSHHGFDMPGVDMEVSDPFGNQGRGGTVVMRYNSETTQRAHRMAVEFFSAALK